MRRLLFATMTFALLAACGSAAPSATATPVQTPTIPAQAMGCPASSGPNGPSLTGVAFADAKHGIAVGSDGFIWQTSDGGDHWNPVQAPPTMSQINGVALPAVDNYWIWGDGGIYHHAAGSSTWVVSATGLPSAVTAVAFVGGTPVAAVDAKGGISHTADGTSWTLDVRDGGTAPLASVAATDAQHIVAVGSGGSILLTINGGTSWFREPSATTKNLHAVAMTSATTGFAAGDIGTLLVTSNGGSTWGPVASFPLVNTNLLAIEFTDASHGWVVGGGGEVVVTTDGGQTWQQSIVTDGIDIHGVSFVAAPTGWVVGTTTGVYKSTDSGTTWKRRNYCGN